MPLKEGFMREPCKIYYTQLEQIKFSSEKRLISLKLWFNIEHVPFFGLLTN